MFCYICSYTDNNELQCETIFLLKIKTKQCIFYILMRFRDPCYDLIAYQTMWEDGLGSYNQRDNTYSHRTLHTLIN